MFEKILKLINNLLTFNFFFVLLSFAWFVVAIVGQYAHLPLGMQVWRSLWDPLFLPAISVLMAGAIVSGTISYILKDRAKSSF